MLRLFLILILLFSVVSPDYSQEVIEEIVAIVNDEIITLSEIRTEYEKNRQVLRVQFQGEELNSRLELLKKGLLDQMVTAILLLQEAAKLGIDVEEQVKLFIDNIKKEYNINSDEEFFRVLRQQGIEYEEWKGVLTKNMLKEAVIATEVHINSIQRNLQSRPSLH
jgi:peptidyl-prolyl cis-trans isomerase SurA